MKHLHLRISVIVALFFVGFLANSCTEDGTGGGTGPIDPLEPFLQFLDESNAIIADTEVTAGAVFRVKLDVQKGDNPLESLTIREDGTLVPTARLEFNSGFTTVQNPYLVTGTDVDGFEIIIDIEAHSDGVRTYSFIAEDQAGETDEISIDITIGASGEPIDDTFTMILLNNADGPSEGGLDLDVPEAVSSSSDNAEIRDMGIDLNQPIASNWRQRIEPVNGAVLAVVTSAGYNFADIETKGQVVALFDEGEEVDMSSVVATGDAFVVRKDNDYFLLEVTEIILTSDDNNDYYQFDIKQALDVQ